MWHILYGSQTGQSQAIAEDIAAELQSRGGSLRVELKTLSDLGDLIGVTRAVIVCSSTGDGDPPDNAAKFYRRLMRPPEDWPATGALSRLRYALLGLGDTNYSSYAKCPRTIDARLRQLGAQPFYPTAIADDAVGLELTVGPFLLGLYPAIDAIGSADICDVEAVAECLAKVEVAQVAAEEVPSDIIDECRPVFGDSLEGVTWPSPSQITLPSLPQRYLRVVDAAVGDASCSSPVDVAECGDGGGHLGRLASAAGDVHLVRLTSIAELSSPEAPKRIWRATLDVSAAGWSQHLRPGDSLSLCPANCPIEVAQLLHRLGEDGSRLVWISADKSSGKRIPDHLPVDRPITLSNLLHRFVDIRQPPSNLLRRVLAEYVADQREKLRLQQLCAREASEARTRLLLEPRLSLLDLLNLFPSCKPPFEHLLAYLPRLQPRPYSLANWATPQAAQFYFSEVSLQPDAGRTYERLGVCTGWLRRLAEGAMLPAFPRENRNFRLTDQQMIHGPLVLIGPGTGCAPLCAFLDWRRHWLRQQEQPSHQQEQPSQQQQQEQPSQQQQQEQPSQQQQQEQPSQQQQQQAIGEAWLYYGCRRPEWDFAFKEAISTAQTAGSVQRVRLAFSRLPVNGRRVTDLIRGEEVDAAELRRLLLQPPGSTDACVLVAGDANSMAKDVAAALADALAPGLDGGATAANHILAKMRIDGRYKEDVWS